MHRLALVLAGIALLALALPALGEEIVVDDPVVAPYEGIWIPVGESGIGEPGSGVVMDRQNDTLVVTIYTYREDGTAIWYLASGPIENGVFEQPAYEYRDGACLNCTWTHAVGHSSVTLHLAFIGHTLAWMTWNGNEPIPIRVLPFDVPIYSSFFASSPFFGEPGMYNMSGRWLFISEEPFETLLQAPLFESFGYLDPGGAIWAVSSGEWEGHGLFCRSNLTYTQYEVAHCVYDKVGDNVLMSLFWGDTAPDRLIGYKDPLKFGTDGDIRGDDLVQGYRLTGPVVPEGDQGFPAASAEPAVYIEKGLWLTPGEPGSGLALDWQDDTLVFTVFTYDEQGNPAWYQGSGAIVDGVVEALAYRFTGGTCLNCDYADSHQPGEPIEVRFEFQSKTTAWLTFDDGAPKPLRAFAFDAPRLREFGTEGDFGTPTLQDLRGEWVFVSTKGLDRFYRRITFTQPTSNGPNNVAWRNAEGTISFSCDADPERFASPQCRLLESDGEQWVRLFSAHWADVGEDQIIGYEEKPLSGESGKTRGEKLIFGFRLSGPGG